MSRTPASSHPSRREFLAQSGSLAAGAALLGSISSRAYAGEDNTIRLALIGCGNRGSGAVRDALSVQDSGPVELYAMADVQESSMARSHKGLTKVFGERADVPKERMFLGFDAYRKAIDILRPGDIAMCTTRAYIRPVHVEYAVQKGINVFMEKPFASDPGGLNRMLKAGELAEQTGVKIAAGLQCRHSPARQALIQQIRDGVLGDIHLIRANRWGGSRWLKNQGDAAYDLISQLNFGKAQLLWVGSGHMVDNLIHQIDECCWIKDSWPVACRGMGARLPHSTDAGQNLDAYSMEYTFADGTKAFCGFRRMDQTDKDFTTFLHGTKCAAQFSGVTHAATVHRFHDQRTDKDNIAWTPTDDAVSPWQYEWNDFIASIRQDRPHNEARRAVYSDYASLMGRAACHIGKTITWDQITSSEFLFCDDVDAFDYGTEVPIKPNEEGRFPVPIPGFWNEI